MTLGDKIRTYRNLKGWTQKKLGLEVGFSAATADSRIRKYEKNLMAPKEEIRNKLANALDIDLEAISDIKITSYVDLMHIFFELEEKYSMDIIKKEGKTYLTFDDNNKDTATLISFLNLWHNKKNTLVTDEQDLSDNQNTNYLLWKSHFSKNITEYYNDKKSEINLFYKPFVSEIQKKSVHAKKTSEITRLFREIIEAGMYVSVTTKSIGTGITAQGFTFVVNELLNPANDKCTSLFAKFLYEYNHFIELGADCFTEMQMTDKSLTRTYFVPVSSFSIITSQVNMLLDFREKKDNQTDFSIDSFESDFKDSLEIYNNNIEDDIKMS